MLQLKDIVKNYITGDQTVEALKGISLSFRKSEFVAILGPSGCGKTTLLNIVGGLDRYTSGDIVINGVSTRLYDDSDWDTYRNHSIGFIFQSYNLIPHQTILENVELALTLSGISPKERRKRAEEALTKVGLPDKFNKLPAQLSGGQMQRVAIARAIVNDPDIILADEPTGALDTETSVQVMNILRELSKDRLIIMVTHNPDLAVEYATRIIRLKDGTVREDTNPFVYTEQEKNIEREQINNRATKKKPSMSLLTALSLSLKNLSTKKARTFLTSFAGSIGIIGIALILSLSTGFNGYIANVQRDTLSNYPVEIKNDEVSLMGFFTSFMGATEKSDKDKFPADGKVHSGKMFNGMLNSLSSSLSSNDLGGFKKYIDEHPELIDSEKISAVNYSYDFAINFYQKNPEYNAEDPTDPKNAGVKTYKQVAHIGKFDEYVPSNMPDNVKVYFKNYYTQFKMYMEKSDTWSELAGGIDLVEKQYDVLAGELEKGDTATDENGAYYPLTIVVDQYNTIPDYSLYMMGIMTDEEVRYMFSEMAYTMLYRVESPDNYQDKVKEALAEQFKDTLPNGIQREFTFEELVGREFNVLLASDYYVENTPVTIPALEKTFNRYKLDPNADTNDFYAEKFGEDAIRLKVTSVIRLKKNVTDGALSKNIYYTPALTDRLIEKLNETPVTRDQMSYLYSMPKRTPTETSTTYYAFNVLSEDDSTDSNEGLVSAPIEDSEINGEVTFDDLPKVKTALADTFKKLGIVDKEKPSSIRFYPTSFENKDYVIDIINNYNAGLKDSEKIQYTDYIGMMISSVTTIINAISYVLIAFVSISLVVSSIMIGVITYISVLERTKEIGILRSLGASKRDVGRVFNAETMIIGFISGALGIIVTVILDIPISLIINHLAGIPHVAALPVLGGIILIAISVCLTLIAGIIPSRLASKRDPVIALRSE